MNISVRSTGKVGFLVLLAVAAVIGLYFGLGAGQAGNPIHAAQQMTEDMNSYRQYSRQTINFPTTMRVFESWREVGASDRFRLVLESEVVFKDLLEQPQVHSDCERQEIIFIKDTAYQRCDTQPWSVEQAPESFSFSLSGLDTTYALRLLDSLENVRELSNDEVDGVAVRVFEANADAADRAEHMWPDSSLQALPEEARERKLLRKAAFAEATIIVTVYIGTDDSLVRRIQQLVEYPGSNVDEPYTSQSVVDFYDHGAPIVIAAPTIP